VAGGRFIAYTDNPAFTLSKPNCTKYGVTVLRLEPEEDRYVCKAEFVTAPPFRVRWYQWHQTPYEWALQEAGFRDCVWYPLGGGAGRWHALWGGVWARFLRQLSDHRVDLPQVTSGTLPTAAYIDDEVVDSLTASGTLVECRRKIETYRTAEVQLPILSPLDPNVHMAIETLGPLR
jgi:hypothetical protein